MSQKALRPLRVPAVALAIAIAVLAIWLVPQTQADDRALFQAANAKPNVFFIVDISSSMHRTPEGARPPASGEDPSARLYQAKSATYEVISRVGDEVNYGWATFNREEMEVRRKHHLYNLAEDPSFVDLVPIEAGRPVIFGEPRHRRNIEVGDNGSDDRTFIDDDGKFYSHRSCEDPTTNRDRILDFPKGGHVGDFTTVIYYRNNSRNREFRITFLPLSGADNNMGDLDIDVTVRIEERTGNCNGGGDDDDDDDDDGGDGDEDLAYTLVEEETLNFVRFYDGDGINTFADFTDYISFDRSGNDTSTFAMDGYQIVSACSADRLDNPSDPDDNRSHRWDGNFDGDLEFGDQLTYDVLPDPLDRGRELQRGDMIPWDWENNVYPTSNREEILLRLAPNIAIGETVPDFRVARYFENVPVDEILPLKADFVDRPPIMNARGTPIAGALTSFEGWYNAWLTPAREELTGDPLLPCRQKYIILLTDGAESCESGSLSDPGSNRRSLPREAAERLYDLGIRTFVVAFGTTSAELASLQDIADAGGTGALDKDLDGEPDGPGPFPANNREELIEALDNVFDALQQEAISISAAAVPSVQADVSDKIYLTEFTPLDGESVWPGSLQSFVKPLPTITVDDRDLPDTGLLCDADRTTGCLAWDAQEVVVREQVKGSELEPLGFNRNQRRIFYSPFATLGAENDLVVDENIPRGRRLLQNVEESALGIFPDEAFDLWRGFGFDFDPSPTQKATQTAAFERAGDTISGLTALKESTLPDGRDVEFVIGDFFHSDPLVVNAPGNTSFFLQDLEGDLSRTCEEGDEKSYRCFALLHQYRRKMLFIGSNGGMLHAFDAGNYQLPPSGQLVDLGEFDNGTGRELFAYVPRPVLSTLVDMFVDQPSRHQFTVDGPPVAADVFIDPVHAGAPSDDDREWRTVLMGGLRRGGSSMGDRAGTFGELLDPDVVTTNATFSNADIQLTSGYYMLDITQPDLIQETLLGGGENDRDEDGQVDIWVPREIADTGAAPACLGSETGTLPAGCGPVPFASVRWEFLDTLNAEGTPGGMPIRLDEDNNGFVDLGFTWSSPVISRLRVCVGTSCDPNDPAQVASGDQQDRYVAIFGGGVDPLHIHLDPSQTDPDLKDQHLRGNFLYIVDIESGKAIYKHAVTGSVAASPTVIPTADGYVDRIYFGTTAGLLYRLDMRPESTAGATTLPKLVDTSISETYIDPDELDPALRIKTVTASMPRVELPGSRLFEPIAIFDANKDAPDEPRYIYMSPSVFLIADIGETGIAFGTGNREDLFKETLTFPAGETARLDRFFVIVDDTTGPDLRESSFEPRTIANLQRIDSADSFSGQDLLTEPIPGERGWYLTFEEEERLVGDPLIIAGVLFFSTFTPSLPDFVDVDSNVLCEESGTSRIYGTLVTNAEGILADEDRLPARNIEVGGLVTAPFAEQSQTKNPFVPDDGDGEDDQLSPELRALMEELKGLFPANCTFPPGHRLDIKVRNQDTGLTFVVPVPICVVETAFKEF